MCWSLEGPWAVQAALRDLEGLHGIVGVGSKEESACFAIVPMKNVVFMLVEYTICRCSVSCTNQFCIDGFGWVQGLGQERG